MRILHITTDDHGGAGLCCLRIHQSLFDAGIESKVVTICNTRHAVEEYSYGRLQDLFSRVLAKGLRLINLPFTDRSKIGMLSKKYHTAYSLPVSTIDLTKCEWAEWADIIHLHWVNNYLDYPSFFRQVKKPIVWTLHDENLFYGIAHHHKSILASHPLEIKYRQVKQDAVHSAENLTIVFLSEMMQRRFKDEKIIEGRQKWVINNSVDTSVFRSYDKSGMREKYGIDRHKKVCLFIAVDICDPNKGLNVLSDALSDTDVEILAIGGNPSKKGWNNVRQVGLVRDLQAMAELISCADFFAMPSYQEAFSQSPIEAMACGLPVVAFPVSGTSELVNDRNGVVCDDFTPEALRKGINKLMDRDYVASEIRQDMINRFSPEVIARRYVEVYQKIM